MDRERKSGASSFFEVLFMKKIFASPDFWRSAFGLLVGILFTAIGSLAIFSPAGSTPSFFEFLAYPIVGFIALTDELHLPFFEAIVPFMIALFYPVLLTLLFYMAGKKQAWKVLLLEIVIAGLILYFGMVGMAIAGLGSID